jgi:hypothetical protein
MPMCCTCVMRALTSRTGDAARTARIASCSSLALVWTLSHAITPDALVLDPFELAIGNGTLRDGSCRCSTRRVRALKAGSAVLTVTDDDVSASVELSAYEPIRFERTGAGVCAHVWVQAVGTPPPTPGGEATLLVALGATVPLVVIGGPRSWCVCCGCARACVRGMRGCGLTCVTLTQAHDVARRAG